MAKKKAAKTEWSEDKQEALNQVIDHIHKAQGVESLMLGQKIVDVDSIPTGALTLDLALGVGGIPKGRVTEIFGPEGSGKTTLMLHVLANAQKQGGIAAFVDAEHALDPGYAASIGVDLDKILISQPDNGEQALEIVDLLCESKAVDAIVVDSVAALVPKAELDGSIGDSHVGLQARMMSQAMRKLCSKAKRSNTAVVFINQLREKIGVMFGSPETTSGGRALKFYSSVRLDIRRIATNKDTDGQSSGNVVRVKVVKNKVAPPFRQAEFEIIFGKGINRAADILDLAVQHKFLKKSGNFYRFGEINLGNGKNQATKYLESNLPLLEELEVEILDKIEKERESVTIVEEDNKGEDDENEDT